MSTTPQGPDRLQRGGTGGVRTPRRRWEGWYATRNGIAATLLVQTVGCAAAPAPELSDAVVLAATGGSNPTVAIDPRTGAGYVVWVETTDRGSNVLLVRMNGEDASELIRVNDLEGDAAPHLQAPPRVVVGPDGTIHVAWQNNTPIPGRMYPASDLRFARSTDGGRTFEPALTVNDDAGGVPASHTFHDLIVTDGGDVIVSWLDGRRSAASVPLEAGHATHSEASDILGPELRVARSRDGGRTFGPSHVADVDACPCCRTDLAAGPDGSLYVGWRKIFPGEIRDVVVARSVDGGAHWEEPVRVHADDWVFPGCPHAGPAVAVDHEGTVHVAWYTGKEGGAGLYYARSSNGGRDFSTPDPLVAPGRVPPSQVDLTVAPDGRLWGVWEHRTGEVQSWLISTGSVGPRSAREIRGTHPALGVGPRESLVAWLRGDSLLVSRIAH